LQKTSIRSRILDSRLEARDGQLLLIARQYGCGVWTFEPDTGEITCSDQGAALLGVANTQRLSLETLLNLVQPEDRPRVRTAFAQALRVRDEFTVEFRLVAADGTRTWLRCSGRPHASALDPARHALSGVLQAMEAESQPGVTAAEPKRMGAMVERLERLHELELRTVASRLMSEIAPRLNGLRQRIGRLTEHQDLTSGLHSELVAVANETDAWLNTLRAVLFEMLPPAVAELGFAGALERYATEQLSAAGVEVALALPSDPLPLPATAQEALYHVARAGIDNVVRHANARNARVSVECDGRQVVLNITDDGTGLRQTDLMKEGALGLFAESERLASAGGELRVSGRPGQGTTLEACIPLRNPVRQQAPAARVA
jgi:two-component system sensor histidine kinase UhpB